MFQSELKNTLVQCTSGNPTSSSSSTTIFVRFPPQLTTSRLVTFSPGDLHVAKLASSLIFWSWGRTARWLECSKRWCDSAQLSAECYLLVLLTTSAAVLVSVPKLDWISAKKQTQKCWPVWAVKPPLIACTCEGKTMWNSNQVILLYPVFRGLKGNVNDWQIF